MNIDDEQFVHVFLFRCPSCAEPMSSTIATGERNPEETDAQSFALQCDCGWAGARVGLLAKRHWVEGWSRSRDIGTQ
jgi:hypothetical protein